MHVPLYKRLVSFLYPVCVERRFSSIHPVLDLYLHRNQWQLATDDSIYSDGRRYRPLLSAFKKIRKKLSGVNNVLVLGTGLGSAVHILEHMGLHPAYTLVELDNTVLKMAIELMPRNRLRRINPVCMDAEIFMHTIKPRYQLIICDVFINRDVPAFVPSITFLEECKKTLQPSGNFILNYIEKSKTATSELRQLMDNAFPGYSVIEFGINKIFVAAV
ncbi:MAG: hypothetical protein EOO05_18125 [Chitinophagaceae bacterium]|nr:MAG: hypothetical protein EOO05_18125 [Chitinophagaceae bacterium]